VGDLDVVIDVDAAALPFGELVTGGGERLERRPVDRSKSIRRLTPATFIGRSLIASICSRMAAFRSASVKKVWWRNTASTQRWAIWTLTSTIGLSVGVAGRAGMTTAP